MQTVSFDAKFMIYNSSDILQQLLHSGSPDGKISDEIKISVVGCESPKHQMTTHI